VVLADPHSKLPGPRAAELSGRRFWCGGEICHCRACEPPDIYRRKAEAAEANKAQSRARSHRDVPTAWAAAGMHGGARGESGFAPSWDLRKAPRGTCIQISLFIYFSEKISMIYFL